MDSEYNIQSEKWGAAYEVHKMIPLPRRQMSCNEQEEI